MKAIIIPKDYTELNISYEDMLSYTIEIDIPFTPVVDIRIDLSEEQNETLTRLYEEATRERRKEYKYDAIDFSDVSIRIESVAWDCKESYFLIWCSCD